MSRKAKVVLACCVSAGVVWFVGLRPCWTYCRLNGAAETGVRHDRLAELKKQGPLGRHFARGYALRWTRRSPSYGHFFILYNRDLWIGMERDEIHDQLGDPDEVLGYADIWYIGRRYALEQLKWDDDYSWERAQFEWDLCLAAEYEDGVLVRLGNPVQQVTYLDEIERSPYQTRLRIDVDYEQLDTPPPEWLKAKEGR